MKVESIEPLNDKPVKTINHKMTRDGFSNWLRNINKFGQI